MEEDKKVPLMQCPFCGYLMTVLQVKSARINLNCRGFIGKPPRVTKCKNSLSDYKVKDEP